MDSRQVELGGHPSRSRATACEEPGVVSPAVLYNNTQRVSKPRLVPGREVHQSKLVQGVGAGSDGKEAQADTRARLGRQGAVCSKGRISKS